MEFSQILLEHFIILIEKIKAAGGGHAGCRSYQNSLGRI